MDLSDKKAMKDVWVTALTDGSHAQCSNTLYNVTRGSFCCLGVAAHVWGVCDLENMASQEDSEGSPQWEGPGEVYERLKELIPFDLHPLVDMNDGGEPFSHIAEEIRERWDVS